MDRVEQGWIGIDGGKDNHHAVLIDRDGQRLLSRRVINDEPDLVALIDTVQERVVDPVWAIDLATGSASLLIALLLQRDQRVVYLPGMAVNRASAGYRGEGKTDAKDAAIIADQARMRRDLRELHVLEEDIAQLSAAQFLSRRSGRRPHPKDQLGPRSPYWHLSCPETSAGLHQPWPLILISGFQTPTAIRQLGAARLTGWLKRRGVRGAGRLAHAAVGAATRQNRPRPWPGSRRPHRATRPDRARPRPPAHRS